MKQTKRLFTTVIIAILTAAMLLTGCASVPAAPQISVTQAPTTEPTAVQTLAETTVSPVAESISYVSIDVNPSLKLTIKDGIVSEALAFNDDGTSIVLNYAVVGLSPIDAVNTLVNAFATEGYITAQEQNSLVITAYGDGEDELLQSMKDAASQSLTQLGLECDIVVSGVEPEIDDIAAENGLTPGRYLLLNYLAEKEGITLEEAKAKYGSLKMGKLVKLVDDVDAVFGHKDGDLQQLIDSGILTPEQAQILTQAQSEFKAAMKLAQQAFVQARKLAQSEIKAAKAEAQKAFKADKNKEVYKQTKATLQEQFSLKKQQAKDAFFAAKTQAQETFRAAVASLGLTEEQIAALIAWDFDFDWDFDWDDDVAQDKDDDQDDDQDDDKETTVDDGSDDGDGQKPEATPSAAKSDGSTNGQNGNKGSDKNDKGGKKN